MVSIRVCDNCNKAHSEDLVVKRTDDPKYIKRVYFCSPECAFGYISKNKWRGYNIKSISNNKDGIDRFLKLANGGM